MKKLMYITGLILFLAACTNAADTAVPGARGEVAAKGGMSTPSFIVSKGGTAFPVPKGVTGPIGAQSGKGIQYIGGRGGNGLSTKVSGFRFMDPVTTGKYQYTGGYGSYFNSAGQTINPFTGQTIPRSSPWWHIIAK
ncbi:MAG: hypothetical protein LBV74_04405 [Tannerella sp.]|jgi:hypothetical protein|nr:hypothetical protein [Tannerella sp.]